MWINFIILLYKLTYKLGLNAVTVSNSMSWPRKIALQYLYFNSPFSFPQNAHQKISTFWIVFLTLSYQNMYFEFAQIYNTYIVLIVHFCIYWMCMYLGSIYMSAEKFILWRNWPSFKFRLCQQFGRAHKGA